MMAHSMARKAKSPITFNFSTKALDLDELCRLSTYPRTTFGWLIDFDPESGGFSRKHSHVVMAVARHERGLRIVVDPLPTTGGVALRRLYDECCALEITPHLRGPTNRGGDRVWLETELVAWDVFLRPYRDSVLDKILNAVDRG